MCVGRGKCCCTRANGRYRHLGQLCELKGPSGTILPTVYPPGPPGNHVPPPPKNPKNIPCSVQAVVGEGATGRCHLSGSLAVLTRGMVRHDRRSTNVLVKRLRTITKPGLVAELSRTSISTKEEGSVLSEALPYLWRGLRCAELLWVSRSALHQ